MKKFEVILGVLILSCLVAQAAMACDVHKGTSDTTATEETVVTE